MRYQYRSFMRGLTLSVTMALLHVLGTEWAPLHDAFSPVTPLAGVAIVGLFLWGFRMLPWLVAGSVVGRILETPDLSIRAIVALMVGNTVAYVLAVAHLRAGPFSREMSSVSDVKRFLRASTILAIVSCVVPLFLLIPAVAEGDLTVRSAFEILTGMLFGRFSGAMIVGAVILTFKWTDFKNVFTRAGRRALLCVLSAVVATAIVFGPFDLERPITWLAFPPLIVAAFVGGGSLTSQVLLIIGVGSVWGTTVGFGPFSSDPLGYAILKQFLAVISATGLVLSGAARERLDKDIAEQRGEDLRFLSDSAVELLLSTDIAASVRRCMPALARRCDVDFILYHSLNGGGVDAIRRAADYGLETNIADADLLARIESRVKDVAREPRPQSTGSELVTSPRYFSHSGMLVCFPIFYAEALLGVLSVGSTNRSTIDPGERKLINTIVFYISAADQRLRRKAERKSLLGSERVARMEAERADQLKNEFLAVLSHELRNPLNAIVGWTQLLQRGKVDVTRATKIIEQSARLQSQLIEDLLDMSRIESGKLTVKKALVDLTSLVAGACEATRLLAQEKGVELELRLEPEVKMAAGDSVRINQIASNLLSNAIKFTPPKGRVTVSLAQESESAVLTVADNGAGISEDFMPHLFNRFRQADQSTTRRYGGLGLGLAIAKHMTELHGGTIEAHSPGLGKGATFIVRLPMAERSGVGLTWPTPEKERGEHKDDIALRGRSIVVVEDDASTLEMLSRSLSDRGATVISCERGLDALEAIRSRTPDLIISDIGMPDMDGYELMRQLRRTTDRRGHYPAIALTAFARPEDKDEALKAGFDAHLSKPVNLRRLEELATELMLNRGEQV